MYKRQPVTLTNILRFAVPTIAMSVFMSFYTMVDGLFVSNLIGTSALYALNLVYPVIALVTAISTMLATGGSAAIMRKMGEGKMCIRDSLTVEEQCGRGHMIGIAKRGLLPLEIPILPVGSAGLPLGEVVADVRRALHPLSLIHISHTSVSRSPKLYLLNPATGDCRTFCAPDGFLGTSAIGDLSLGGGKVCAVQGDSLSACLLYKSRCV